MKRLHTEVLIDAGPAEVWSVLTDFESYPDWNPFLVRIGGTLEPGQALRVTLAPPGGRRLTIAPTVTEVVPGSVFEWWGHLGIRGIFDGRHRFELHPSGAGTRLVHGETFTGVLVPVLSRSLDRGTAAGFELMNAALKARVERGGTGRP